MAEIIIVGIGNLLRGDDAIGWAVIDRLQGKVNPSIQLSRQRGDISELMDVFTSYKSVYLVDACLAQAPLGNWMRIDVLQQSIPVEGHQTSTHGWSVSQAIALAHHLNQLPEKLILYAISGDNFSLSHEVSLPLKEAIDRVIEAILQEEEIRACMKRV